MAIATATAPTVLGRRINATRPHAERIVDEDQSVIVLDLEPIGHSLVRDIARAIAADNRLAQLLAVGRLPIAHPDAVAAEHALLRTLRAAGVLQLEISDAQAEEIAEELDVARVEPEQCEIGSCDLLAQPGHSGYCQWHSELTL